MTPVARRVRRRSRHSLGSSEALRLYFSSFLDDALLISIVFSVFFWLKAHQKRAKVRFCCGHLSPRFYSWDYPLAPNLAVTNRLFTDLLPEAIKERDLSQCIHFQALLDLDHCHHWDGNTGQWSSLLCSSSKKHDFLRIQIHCRSVQYPDQVVLVFQSIPS